MTEHFFFTMEQSIALGYFHEFYFELNWASNFLHVAENDSIQAQTNPYYLYQRNVFALLQPCTSQAIFQLLPVHDL